MAVLIMTDEWNSREVGTVKNADWFRFFPDTRESYNFWAAQARSGHRNPCFAHKRAWKAYAIPATHHPKMTGCLVENEEDGTASFERFEINPFEINP